MNQKSVAIQNTPQQTALQLSPPQTLFERMQSIREGIARRAFEIFENDGSLCGRDWDHWFKAEAELLHPVHMSMTESDDTLAVQAEVPGFQAKDLEVSLEPQRLTISGTKETSKEGKTKEKLIYQEHCSAELFRAVDLPVEVDAAKATAKLKNGILELNLPKVEKAKSICVEEKAA